MDLVAVDAYWAAPFGSRAEARASDRWEAVDIGNGVISLIALAEWIAVFVLLVVWMNKAHTATQRLWSGPRTWSSGWTVGGWFIPLAQLVIPATS